MPRQANNTPAPPAPPVPTLEPNRPIDHFNCAHCHEEIEYAHYYVTTDESGSCSIEIDSDGRILSDNWETDDNSWRDDMSYACQNCAAELSLDYADGDLEAVYEDEALRININPTALGGIYVNSAYADEANATTAEPVITLMENSQAEAVDDCIITRKEKQYYSWSCPHCHEENFLGLVGENLPADEYDAVNASQDKENQNKILLTDICPQCHKKVAIKGRMFNKH